MKIIRRLDGKEWFVTRVLDLKNKKQAEIMLKEFCDENGYLGSWKRYFTIEE